MLLRTGLGDSMLKVVALDWPPPGPGVVTTTWTEPFAVTNVAGTAAFISLLPTSVVVNGVELQSTIDPLVKPLPFKSSVKAAPPSITLVGAMEVITGIGL